MVFAVNAGAVATPPALVVTMGLAPKAPEAPAPGAANVPLTPDIPLPTESATLACNAVANAVLTCALCGVPAVALMLVAAPGLLVSEKLAGNATPLTVAATAYEPAMRLAVHTSDLHSLLEL